MQNVHGRSESKWIVLNELNQPIGPTKEVVSELGCFLGTLARNGTFCPLNIFNWKMLKTHDDMWNYIKEKYDIPEVGKDWALGAIKLAWRGNKSRKWKRRCNKKCKKNSMRKKIQWKEMLQVNIIAQLQCLNPGLTLDPNMRRFTLGSPGDGAALQLINRPYVGCNNQGIENEERGEDHCNEDDIDLT
ncbi:hypothetical protein MTR67_002072 [Solanum verrucosum]|uniref:Uncharacterized protein n=1 Tax=Solanum verrucosum TaxID=315347 RepID=A0AAF0PQB1_SOLVR|nr:hypothetical protein MTR67_002072 [Solanum verrucosum]